MRREDYAPLAVQDDLTGLHNRRSLLQILRARAPGDAAAFVLLDFEGFRAVNDQLGRPRGDRLLRDFSERLRMATGEGETLARWGGTSFGLLLPGRSRDEAGAFIEQFFQSLGDPALLTPAEMAKANPPVAAGVAGFPADGPTVDSLVAAASRALFAAKRGGGKRVAVSGKLDPAHVAERLSLDAFPCRPFEGRNAEFETAEKLVESLLQRKSSLLLVEGAPGTGKSRYLAELSRRAATAGIRTIALSGSASRKQVSGGAFLAAVHRHFATRPEAVQSLQRRFGTPQRTLLADLVPALASWRPEKGDVAGTDPGLLDDTLRQVFTAIAGHEPVLLLLDEAQHIDRGTLDLLRYLVNDSSHAVGAVLAIQGEARSLRPERDRALVEFIFEFTKSRKMRAVAMGPLPMASLLRMVDALLPGARLPDSFAESLAKASQGNPLYLTEAIRSMILRKLVLKSADGWKVTPFERAELPLQIEDVVRSVIEALSPDTRELLGRAAVLGTQFDLQTLQDTLGQHEAAVLDGVDAAAEAGLIRPVPDGPPDDWEFAAGHVREIRYRLLTEDAKLRIHRRASAVLRLRAVDQVGVRSEMIFHAQVARGAYELAEVEESTEPSRPARPARLPESTEALGPEAHEAALVFLDALKACVRLRRIYPQWKQVGDGTRDRAWAAWSVLEKKSARVTFTTAPRELRINGQAHAVDSTSGLPELRLLLVDRLVGSMTLARGFQVRELDALITGLAAPMDKPTVSADHWDQLLEEHGVTNADLVQRRYVVRDSETAAVRLSGLAPERLLRGEDFRLFWRAMRFLKGAADNLKHYPPGQELCDAAFAAAAGNLEELLDQAGRVTVAVEKGSLLVNGLAVPVEEAPDIAAFLTDELESKRLRSFSLLAGAPQDELRVLVSVFSVADVVTAESIIDATRTRHLIFRVQEEVPVGERVSDMHLPTIRRPGGEEAGGLEEESEPIPIGPVRIAPGYLVIRVDLRARACLVSPIDYFLSERSEKELPLMIETLRFGDLIDLADALVKRVGSCLAESEAVWRRRAILIVTRLLGDASGESLDQMISTFREPLQSCLVAESDRDALRLLTEAVRVWTKGALEARRLPLLANFLQQAVRPKLDSAATPREFKMGLSAKLQTLAAGGGGEPALEMLRTSPAPLRHMAIQILAMIGAPMIPELIEIVATHPAADVRRMASVALKEIGGTAQQDLARVVRADAPSQKTIRALEVLELAGPGNIATPVYEALRHADPAVAKEAVKLVGRVERPVALATLRWVLMKEDFKVRLAALDIIREIKMTDLAGDVARLLQEGTDEAVLQAACRTLVAVPTPSAIPHLKRIFEQKSRAFGMVKGLADETRARAVAAAAVIDHPEAVEITNRATSDKSPAVREASVRPVRKK